MKHLAGIAAKEAIEIEPEALALIARAAEGSVRDSLSLLDQAIAHAAGPVRAEHVRQMLGLADRARVIDLFEALMRGDVAAALAELRDQYDTGADPAVVLADLAEFTHFVTRVKVVPAVADDPALIEVERTARPGASPRSCPCACCRARWQMLLKGIAEVRAAGRPLAAAEMVLVRIAYAADLPTPDEVDPLARRSARRRRGRPAMGAQVRRRQRGSRVAGARASAPRTPPRRIRARGATRGRRLRRHRRAIRSCVRRRGIQPRRRW